MRWIDDPFVPNASVACNESLSPTDSDPIRPTFAVGDPTGSTPEVGKIKICKVGNAPGTFALTVTPVAGGVASFGSPVSVTQGTCKIVLEDVDPAFVGSDVKIQETSAGLVSATGERIDNGVVTSFQYTDNSTSLFINNFHGYTLTYTNEVGRGCTVTLGFWKNHASAWPVTTLTLGSVSYTKAQLLAIFGTPVRGNGLISLAHQLIAAKLNVAAGASPPGGNAIANADALIGGLVVPSVGSGFLSPSSTSTLTSALDAYNNGNAGPPHCDD